MMQKLGSPKKAPPEPQEEVQYEAHALVIRAVEK
jgi:hypothetical protein